MKPWRTVKVKPIVGKLVYNQRGMTYDDSVRVSVKTDDGYSWWIVVPDFMIEELESENDE